MAESSAKVQGQAGTRVHDAKDAPTLPGGSKPGKPFTLVKTTLPALESLNFAPENIVTTLEKRMKRGIGIRGRCNIDNAKYKARFGAKAKMVKAPARPTKNDTN